MSGFMGSFQRLCGYRVGGGVYATAGTKQSWGSSSVEDFIVCPPKNMVMAPNEKGVLESVSLVEAFDLTPMGVTLWKDKAGVTNIIDWVGSSSYPNPADYIEEAREMGVSRRLSKNLDFSRLGPNSRLILVHARAVIDNALAFYMDEPEGAKPCPRHREGHERGGLHSGMCARLFWQDVIDAEPDTEEDREIFGERAAIREMPAEDYGCFFRPEGVLPVYGPPGIFASFPIPRLEIIKSDDDEHEEALKNAARSGIEISLEDE